MFFVSLKEVSFPILPLAAPRGIAVKQTLRSRPSAAILEQDALAQGSKLKILHDKQRWQVEDASVISSEKTSAEHNATQRRGKMLTTRLKPCTSRGLRAMQWHLLKGMGMDNGCLYSDILYLGV